MPRCVTLDLRAEHIVWAGSGTAHHITVWARPTSFSPGWFNVSRLADLVYLLLDRASRNFLGEFETFEKAEETLLRYVAADPSAAPDLEIWHEDGTEPIPVDPEKLRKFTAA